MYHDMWYVNIVPRVLHALKKIESAVPKFSRKCSTLLIDWNRKTCYPHIILDKPSLQIYWSLKKNVESQTSGGGSDQWEGTIGLCAVWLHAPVWRPKTSRKKGGKIPEFGNDNCHDHRRFYDLVRVLRDGFPFVSSTHGVSHKHAVPGVNILIP